MADKAIFLDRDDTLIEDPGYINNPDQVKLLDGVPAALIALKAMGYKLVVVSNQSAVARGIVTEKTLGQIHERLKQLLLKSNAFLDRIYYCPYHPEGVIEKYRKQSEDRKPNPGMLLTAAKELDLDLKNSWMIGNATHDIAAGSSAGCRTILIDNSMQTPSLDPGTVKPDYRAVNIKEAVNIIKKHHRTSADKPENPAPAPTVSPQPKPVQKFDEPTAATTEKNIVNSEQLLTAILEELKISHRDNMFADFSIARFVAGILQVVVFLCLLISVYFLTSPKGQTDSVLISLGFAVVVQLMSLTFYVMRSGK